MIDENKKLLKMNSIKRLSLKKPSIVGNDFYFYLINLFME